MLDIKERFITDTTGAKLAVVLSIDDYQKLLDIVEEYEDIKDYDERIKDPEWITIETLKKDFDV